MHKYYALAISTSYWKPNDNFTLKIVNALENKIQDSDFVVVSEKALSVATRNIIDESTVKPSLNAKVLSKLWMRVVWGYCFGFLCGFGQRLIFRLRHYPVGDGSRHKQVALEHAGLLQALMFGSEGGIDGSNLPYSYVSLPLSSASEVAEKIRRRILQALGKRVCVVIVDTDKTYTFRNFHFTPRPRPLKGIHSAAGFTTYIAGRVFRFKRSSTPLAVAGCRLQAGEALKIANIADRVRGIGSGATVWDMAARFKVPVTEVSWEMLAKIKHKPIVLVRLKRE